MPDPDGYREWVRDHKSRALVSELMTAQEAVSRFVEDGDYLCYDCNYLQRGPSALIREVIRQKKKDLWVAGKFTWVAVHLLTAGGCASKVDCGFFLFGKAIDRFVHPDEFRALEEIARAKGFLMVSSSPLTRSSYHAGEDFARLRAARGTSQP